MISALIKNYDCPPVNRREILRYAKIGEPAPKLDALVDECLNEALQVVKYRVCYAEFPVKITDGNIDLGFASVFSKSLQKNLKSSEKIVLFAATVGIDIDRLVAKYSSLSPSKALIFDAIGNERIESLCDAFCSDIKENAEKDGYFIRPRFSAGYGDLSLSLQTDIIKTLSAGENIGITLSNSLLMTPSKSVTAIVGLTRENCCAKNSCENCDKTDCEYRRKE